MVQYQKFVIFEPGHNHACGILLKFQPNVLLKIKLFSRASNGSVKRSVTKRNSYELSVWCHKKDSVHYWQHLLVFSLPDSVFASFLISSCFLSDPMHLISLQIPWRAAYSVQGYRQLDFRTWSSQLCLS